MIQGGVSGMIETHPGLVDHSFLRKRNLLILSHPGCMVVRVVVNDKQLNIQVTRTVDASE